MHQDSVYLCFRKNSAPFHPRPRGPPGIEACREPFHCIPNVERR